MQRPLEELSLTSHVPTRRVVAIPELLAEIQNARASLSGPFSADVMDFCARFSARLFKDSEARANGELQALAYFMRRARLESLRSEFQTSQPRHTVPAPRGVVLHIPPSNVSAILVYSWLMSALTGNINIVRVPSSFTTEHRILIRIFNELDGDAADAIRSQTFLVQYGHDDQITAALSDVSDVRVMWGGDETVNRIRRVPLPPAAKELTFPDKQSLALLSTASYEKADEATRDRLAAAFFNDTFWFDQMGCSSPRLVVWHGAKDQAPALSADFFARVEHQVRRLGYRVPLHLAMKKDTFSHGAILDHGVTEMSRYSNELSVLTVERLDGVGQGHCGGGLLYQYFADDLSPVLRFLSRRHQTLTQFGFSGSELAGIATALRAHGVDRVVPVGEALTFHQVWDGYDLLQEFSRRIYVQEAALATA